MLMKPAANTHHTEEKKTTMIKGNELEFYNWNVDSFIKNFRNWLIRRNGIY